MARPASDLRDRILSAARRLFGRVGVDGASMRLIAREAGTSPGMISYHFESKDGLFRAVVDEAYRPFLAELEAIAATEPDPLARVRALLRRFSRVSDEERQAIRVLIREATVASDRVPYVLQRFLAGHVRLLLEALSEARGRGQVREEPSIAMIPALLGPVVIPQLLRDVLAPLLGDGFDELFDVTMRILFYGLVPR